MRSLLPALGGVRLASGVSTRARERTRTSKNSGLSGACLPGCITRAKFWAARKNRTFVSGATSQSSTIEL